jgi:hypothetical protein
VVVGVSVGVACVELHIVSARRRVGVGVLVSFAPERSLGRQLESRRPPDMVSVDWRESVGESLITCASLWAEGVASFTAGKRLYFFACGAPVSDFSSSNGRGDSGINCISSSAPEVASDVSTDSL